MKRKLKHYAVNAAVIAVVAFSSAASATSITNSDGTFNNFGGFDWASNGTAVVNGFNAAGLTGSSSTFDLTYYANATSVVDAIGNILPMTGLILNNFEYTIQAMLNETSTCTADNGGICTAASFSVNSGSFSIWYDTTPDKNMLTGAGLTDGILLITGTLLAQSGGGFNIVSGGLATLQAVINTTNNTYINPNLGTSTATTSLQLGISGTSWQPPTGMPDVNGGTQALPAGYLALQADGNQDFKAAQVPEPGSLALLGLGLTGLMFMRRRKQA